jgi:hypothetical protein
LDANQDIAPEQTYEWRVTFQTPEDEGTYRAVYQMINADQFIFGEKLLVEVTVSTEIQQDAGTKDAGSDQDGGHTLADDGSMQNGMEGGCGECVTDISNGSFSIEALVGLIACLALLGCFSRRARSRSG